VAVIIPTGERLELLKRCVESIFAHTEYSNYQLLMIDNSNGSDIGEYARTLTSRDANFRYLDSRNRPLSFSTLNNLAVQQSDSPLLLFLNHNITVMNVHWLRALVEHGQRDDVGAVGAKLLYPSATIQHAGVIIGVHGHTGHAFKSLPGDSRHYFGFAQVTRNCSAVTGACMLTKRNLFAKLGGFDERKFKAAFHDVDYCLRLRAAGYLIVYTPHAVLWHHSVTKGEAVPNPREVRVMHEKWASLIAHDPYYNPNLTRRSEDYRLRFE
jgi:GT2 family glycosyltransferase